MAQKKGYGKVDSVIARDSSLSIESRAIYQILATYCDKNRECYPSIDQLLRDTGISKDRLYKHLKYWSSGELLKNFMPKAKQAHSGD